MQILNIQMFILQIQFFNILWESVWVIISSRKDIFLIWNKFYIDEIYDLVFIKSLKRLSSFIAVEIDIKIIDALLMNLSTGFIKTGYLVSRLQNANTRFYAFVMLCGISLISTYLIIKLG